MKRIIRLSESDLARIVRRVINEGTETTTMTPQNYTEIGLYKNRVSFPTKSGKDSYFKITPRQYTEKDNKGVDVVKPRYLRLDISHDSGLGATLVWNCDGKNWLKRMVSKPTDNTVFDSNYTGTIGGTEYTASEVMNKGWKSDAFGNEKAVAEMIAKYCPSV